MDNHTIRFTRRTNYNIEIKEKAFSKNEKAFLMSLYAVVGRLTTTTAL